MKKSLLIVVLSMFAVVSYAQQSVQVIWPFAPGSSSANNVRALIENANKRQNKYQFAFVNKPGAGGAIAANTVLNSTAITLMANTSSFYTTPHVITESYNVNQFKIITKICDNRPLAIYTKNLNLFNGTKKEVTVGIVPGGMFALLTNMINKNSTDIKILEVPYKGTDQSLIDLLSNNLDATVSLLSNNIHQDLKVLGITGKRSLGGYSTFQSQNIKGLNDLVVDLFIFSNSRLEVNIQKELHQILTSSHNTQTNSLCEADFGTVSKPEFNTLEKTHNDNKERWKKITMGIF